MVEPTHVLQADLFARIVTFLEKGGCLSGPILGYVESALFTPTPDRLATFLVDDADCERDTLLDLIFSPDEAVQIDLEPRLAANPCSSEDEAVLHDRLAVVAVEAPIRMPDGRHLIDLVLPDFIKSQYLARLHLTWQAHPHVTAAIQRWLSPARHGQIKVRLRNAAMPDCREDQVFLCRFIERMGEHDPDYLACLDLVLRLLAGAPKGIDPFELLAGHKRALFRSLQQVKRFATLLRRSNMETLMLQGIRVPHSSREQLVDQMGLIDRICHAMFGKTEALRPPIDEPLRQVSDLKHPQAAFSALLR